MKILLGLCGVMIVLLAMGCSLGFLSYMHVTASPIILEVVPFLVLAVGVDNLFILVHAYEVSMGCRTLAQMWLRLLWKVVD